MGGSLSIRDVRIFNQNNSLIARIWIRAKGMIEKTGIYLASILEEKLTRDVFDNASSHLAKKLKKPFLNKIKDQIKIFVSSTNDEFAEEYCIDLPEGGRKIELRDQIKEERCKGLSNAERKITCINLEIINKGCKNKTQEIASLIITSIHELLHHFGDFGNKINYKGKEYDPLWLNEGFPEWLAKKASMLLRELNPEGKNE